VSDDLRADFGWVGTAFPSRINFFEQVDWTGIDVAFAGNWQALDDDSPLQQFLIHEQSGCFPNEHTVELYSSVHASANLYRKEGAAGHDQGWAMGPREVELAATGTFFLREPRPESDQILSMLPTFETPEEFGEKLRWWLNHPAERQTVALEARNAIATRTFDNNVRHLLECVAALPSIPT
jgi:hypothetical protein